MILEIREKRLGDRRRQPTTDNRQPKKTDRFVFKGYKVRVGVLGNNEVDFVAEKEGEKKYIQVALTINDPVTLEREFGNLKKIGDNYPKMVITMDTFSGNTHEGIQTRDLGRFLQSGGWYFPASHFRGKIWTYPDLGH